MRFPFGFASRFNRSFGRVLIINNVENIHHTRTAIKSLIDNRSQTYHPQEQLRHGQRQWKLHASFCASSRAQSRSELYASPFSPRPSASHQRREAFRRGATRNRFELGQGMARHITSFLHVNQNIICLSTDPFPPFIILPFAAHYPYGFHERHWCKR